ncbi:hypothetical protein B0T17DRAFT_514159 [Bombardia bombarda]|uniref:Uncharacterized protein n=1 Tax=Bombardia bombarda TaxID=252184 RepID=A0AA39XIM8_9PEZI|nr:hypothetical protein B0T17DRAFT_514159 [Bombardia bombarda]
MSQLNKVQSKPRDPPPTLFLRPSPSASHVSLPGLMASGASTTVALAPGQQPPPASMTGPTLPREARRAGVGGGAASAALRGAANTTTNTATATTTASTAAQAQAAAATAAPGLVNHLNIPPPLPRGESTRTTDRTDALWAEMQATLEEVELSAGGGTRVFGPDHDRKLGELRMAQIALAQAWARSEADEAIETMGGSGGGSAEAAAATTTAAAAAARNMKSPAAGGSESAATAHDGTGKTTEASGATATTTGTDGVGAKSTVGSGSGGPGSSGAGAGTGTGGYERMGTTRLEEEPDVDILLARKRREANDRYFQRVNQGVLDVVAKLEEVATAMRAVEQESKDIWGDGENDSVTESQRS